MLLTRACFVPAIAALLCLGCGGSGSPTTPSGSTTTTNTTTTTTGTTSSGGSTTFSFTRTPLDASRIQWVTPLGNLNPPAHTFPTDHVHFYHHFGRESDAQYDVFAPADGSIVTIQRGNDDALYIASSGIHTYYLGHMLADSSLATGSRVTAGQRVGTTSPVSHALDLGVLNSTVNVAFITPNRYSTNSLHAEAPLPYFAEPLKSQLYGIVRSTAGNLDGTINYDRSGTASGNWFHETLGIAESVGPAAGPRHIAFVRDPEDPSRKVVSLGGTVSTAGIYYMDASDPDPVNITPSSGPVVLHLSNTQQAITGVPMTVTLTTGTRMRVQFRGGDAFYVR